MLLPIARTRVDSNCFAVCSNCRHSTRLPRPLLSPPRPNVTSTSSASQADTDGASPIPVGATPLLRITARFLRVDYTRIMVPFRTVQDGICVLCRDPEETLHAEKWAVVEFDGPTSARAVRERIAYALGQPK